MEDPSNAQSRSTGWRDALLMCLLALAVRLLYLFIIIGDRRPISDADQYLDIARHVAAGDGFSMQWPQLEVHPTAFRPPAYPVLLGGWLRLFGTSVLTARLFNVFVGLLVVAGAYVVGRLIADRTAGLVSAVLVTAYPPLLANDATTLAEPLALLIVLVAMWAVLKRRWVLVGLAGGLLTLTKPAAQGLVVFLAILAFVLEARRRPSGSSWWLPVKRSAVVALAGLVVVVPWIVRNQVELGTTSIVTSNGFNLTAIYGDVARERGQFVDPANDPAYQSLDFRLLRFDEAKWNNKLTTIGINGIREQPAYVITAVIRNLVSWFELTPARNDQPESLDGRDLRVRHATLWLFYVITILGLAGLVAMARNRQTRLSMVLLSLFLIYFTAVSVVTVAPPRLRAPFDLVCCLAVGVLVAQLLRRSSLGMAGEGVEKESGLHPEQRMSKRGFATLSNG